MRRGHIEGCPEVRWVGGCAAEEGQCGEEIRRGKEKHKRENQKGL